MTAIVDRPTESFPKALDDAELEAAYRFFGNGQVTPDAILAPHFRQTAKPTVQDAMRAIAGLGGHLPRNGDPGWLVLGRGMHDLLLHDLLLLELGWRARAQM